MLLSHYYSLCDLYPVKSVQHHVYFNFRLMHRFRAAREKKRVKKTVQRYLHITYTLCKFKKKHIQPLHIRFIQASTPSVHSHSQPPLPTIMTQINKLPCLNIYKCIVIANKLYCISPAKCLLYPEGWSFGRPHPTSLDQHLLFENPQGITMTLIVKKCTYGK